MNNNHVYDMIVVGGGPGGYTAALYAARAGLDTIVLEKLSAGGQMALTEQIDNYPGFENGIDGFSLAEKMQKQAERFGARSEYAEVLRMDLTAVPKLVETSEGIFRGKPWCWPPVRNPERWAWPESRNWWAGAWLTAPPATGCFTRAKRWSWWAAAIPPRQMPSFSAAWRKSDPRPPQRHPAGHQDLLRAAGTGRKRGIPLEQHRFRAAFRGQADRRPPADTVTGEESVVDCDGVFVSVGRQPATALAVGQLALDGGGYIVAGETTETSIPGVYAVGDVRTKPLRQVVTAVADGAVAVHMAEKYIAENR